jgi:hypothetical protein
MPAAFVSVGKTWVCSSFSVLKLVAGCQEKSGVRARCTGKDNFYAKVPPDKVDPRQTVALSLETVGILVGGD